MKKTLLLYVLALITSNTFAQTSERISYQAVVRDANEHLIKGSDIDILITLRQGSKQGTVAYSENHYVKTNTNGLVSLEIGTGEVMSGNFGKIDWSKGPYFVETKVDPDGQRNYSVTGVSKITSVPYSLYAKNAETITGKIDASQVEGLDNYVGNASVDANDAAFTSWDKNSADDFSGKFTDLTEVPEFYSKTETLELISDISGEGVAPQSLNLDNNVLSISQGNQISFNNWDTDASDDFTGRFTDLTQVPELYTKAEVDALISSNPTSQTSAPQTLTLKNNILSITNGNQISFNNWDMDAADDFDGDFTNLKNTPDLYTKSEVDALLTNGNNTSSNPNPSNLILSLDKGKLSISGGNEISFEDWDMEASDDFDGNYASLRNAPELYTKVQVDSIKEELIKTMETGYYKKAKIIDLNDSRSISENDINNTIACKNSATLNIMANFNQMEIGQIINLEVHGTEITVQGGNNVVINGKANGAASIGDNSAFTGGILRKTDTNSYIVL